MLTAEFTQAVDTLIQDASLSDDALHARALRSLEALQVAPPSESNPSHLPVNGPPWALRIQKAIPQYPVFSTLHLLRALYFVADELGLVAGKRYVSASICVCAERAAPVNSESEANLHLRLVEALDDLASTWAAFVLWPFYSHGVDDALNPPRDRHWKFWEDPTLGQPRSGSDEMTPEQRAARVQQRRWKAEVMARDDYRCFMSGRPDTDWFFREHPALAHGDEDEGEDGDLDFDDCDVVPIIKREALLQLPDTDQEITHSILERYFGLDAQTVLEKAEGPQNTLFVNISACVGFCEFRWCLHPTETADRYKITRYAPRNYLGARHVTTHIAFADHSASASRGHLELALSSSPDPSHPNPIARPPSPSPSDSESPTPSHRPALSRAQSHSDSQAKARDSTGSLRGVDLPDRALLRLHAALTGVLWPSGAVSTFDCLLRRPHWLPRPGGSTSTSRWPAPSGGAFWASVVEYAGAEMCLEVELGLRLSVEAL